jgi:cytochrome c
MMPLAGADSSGKALFERRCGGCHALDNEKVGPHLRAVYGRPAAAVPDFPYSDALKKSKITWDEATLGKFLEDPESFAPGSDMAFQVKSAGERAAIIGYLKTLTP